MEDKQWKEDDKNILREETIKFLLTFVPRTCPLIHPNTRNVQHIQQKTNIISLSMQNIPGLGAVGNCTLQVLSTINFLCGDGGGGQKFGPSFFTYFFFRRGGVGR